MTASPDSAPQIIAVFLDVDGTYADFGIVPPAHAEAVRAVRSAGHKVLLDRCFLQDLTARAAAVLDTHGAVYILEGQQSLQVPAAAEARLCAH